MDGLSEADITILKTYFEDEKNSTGINNKDYNRTEQQIISRCKSIRDYLKNDGKKATSSRRNRRPIIPYLKRVLEFTPPGSDNRRRKKKKT